MVQEIPPKKARQGNNSARILKVLIISLVGAFILWGVAEVYYFAVLDPDNPVGSTRDANVKSPAEVEPGNSL
jgi:hypothetical protein